MAQFFIVNLSFRIHSLISLWALAESQVFFQILCLLPEYLWMFQAIVRFNFCWKQQCSVALWSRPTSKKTSIQLYLTFQYSLKKLENEFASCLKYTSILKVDWFIKHDSTLYRGSFYFDPFKLLQNVMAFSISYF